MSSFVYMKVLESQPERYDLGITLLSLGTMDRARRRLADQAVPVDGRLLEIGCGTGALTVLVASRCQEVVAFDVSAPMLAVARRRIEDSGLAPRVRLEERGVSGMDAYEDASAACSARGSWGRSHWTGRRAAGASVASTSAPSACSARWMAMPRRPSVIGAPASPATRA